MSPAKHGGEGRGGVAEGSEEERPRIHTLDRGLEATQIPTQKFERALGDTERAGARYRERQAPTQRGTGERQARHRAGPRATLEEGSQHPLIRHKAHLIPTKTSPAAAARCGWRAGEEAPKSKKGSHRASLHDMRSEPDLLCCRHDVMLLIAQRVQEHAVLPRNNVPKSVKDVVLRLLSREFRLPMFLDPTKQQQGHWGSS